MCAQKRMQEVAKDRDVLTPPRKKVLVGSGGERAKGIRKGAADKVPANDEGWERCQYKSAHHRKDVWESASSESDSWRVTSPTRMLIRNEDAASLIGSESCRADERKEAMRSRMVSFVKRTNKLMSPPSKNGAHHP